ncbi:LysR family transcriptional regulator [Pseudomonas putida]|nr:LysR family transcriptional regulator [Pseudomonas putida]
MDYFAALTAFVEAADENNFSRAAERLGIKASTVSRYVKDLEQELGIALFNRSTRTLHLTEGGRTFLIHARRALEELEEAKSAASALNQHPRGVLRLNLAPAFARHHVLPALKPFLQRFPEIDVEFVLEESQVNLINSGTDLAIRVGRLADSNLQARKIADVTHRLVVSPPFAREHHPPLSPSCLEQMPAIVGSQGHSRITFIQNDETMRLARAQTIMINDLDAQLIAVREGVGYALLPDWLVAKSVAAGELIEWLPQWQVQLADQPSAVWFIYPPKRVVSSKVRSFIDFMIEHVGVEPYWRR